ncbi:acyltransferase family protein [Roseibacillus persicicus]|uniref:Acyltransferase n=1 Tax=Roseibacillus persicicus TaxID=454148 RepID=A0A918TFA8_9BACT|nr:acyltransferase [Roseibacillus persicicus]GHC44237.1 acyltransferase [Roseibacillus persicicus]
MNRITISSNPLFKALALNEKGSDVAPPTNLGKGPGRVNNLDLIRLIVALHVVCTHTLHYDGLSSRLDSTGATLHRLFLLIPAVPIFFVISGFLIVASFERNPKDLKGYFWRRGLRIYPALWVSVLVSLGILTWAGYLQRDFVATPTFLAWLAGQVSFVQFWNLEHFRGFGMGVVNGALWTITVELQYYLFVPLWCLLRGFLKRYRFVNLGFDGVLFVTSVAANLFMRYHVNVAGEFALVAMPIKLLHMTLLPHLWMFILGVYIYRHFDSLRSILEGHFLAWAAAWVVVTGVGELLIGGETAVGTALYVVAQCLLAFVTISLAYTLPALSGKVLRGQDLSYGIYIFHFLILNVLIELGYMTTLYAIPVMLVASFLMGFLSWTFIEKPALSLKNFRFGKSSLTTGAVPVRSDAPPSGTAYSMPKPRTALENTDLSARKQD